MLSKDQLSKLLNRSLTDAEDSNFELYLKIATERLEQLLCMSICKEAGERTYITRYGYRTVYIDPFIEIETITIDGEEVEDYVVKQNNRFNGSWYNIIEFDDKRTGENIVVEADWGFNSCPVDLQLILAQLFNQGSLEQTADTTVQSKKIEDFTVTYKDNATFDELILTNRGVIDKYSQCDQGAIRHGTVWSYDDLRSIRNY